MWKKDDGWKPYSKIAFTQSEAGLQVADGRCVVYNTGRILDKPDTHHFDIEVACIPLQRWWPHVDIDDYEDIEACRRIIGAGLADAETGAY
jgi:hypothetical protein